MSEEYETLMRFHLLMFGKNLSDFKYAAVDHDGTLVCYVDEPSLAESRHMWSNTKPSGDFITYVEIERIALPKDWKETLIEI